MRVALLTGPSHELNHRHRAAAVLDGEAGLALTLPLAGWAQLLELGEGARPDVVAAAAGADGRCLRGLAGAGYPMVIEPPALSPEDAEELARAARQSGSIVTVAWEATAYPMARAAASVVREKRLGALHSVVIEHHQARGTPPPGSHVIGALGPAAESLMSAVTGLRLRGVLAESALNPQSRAHDDAHILLRFEGQPAGHARGAVHLSRTGPRGCLSIRVHGESGSLAWSSAGAGRLHLWLRDRPEQVLTQEDAEAGALAHEAARGGGGGAVEALANLYRAAYEAVRAKREGRARKGIGREFPTTSDLTRAARFAAGALESARAGGVWAEV